MIAAAYVLPHPPVLLEEVGKAMSEKVRATAEACRRVGEEIEAIAPDALVMMSPHSRMVPGSLGLMTGSETSGSFARFGAPRLGGSFGLNDVLTETIADELHAFSSDGAPLPREYGPEELDHGVLVPLMAMLPAEQHASYKFPPLVLISVSWVEAARHLFVGKAIRRAAARRDTRIVFIASGDLSHRLTPDAPAGYNPTGQLFDEGVQSIFTSGRLQELTSFDPEVIDAAGECGLRSLNALAGVFDGLEPDKLDSEVLSYEAPFGVGYMVARVRERSEP